MKEKKTCPRCGELGYGPYVKETRNRPGGQVYRKYVYFMHKVGEPGSIKTVWCYVGRPLARTFDPKLPNQMQESDQVQEKPKPASMMLDDKSADDLRAAKYLEYLENLVKLPNHEEPAPTSQASRRNVDPARMEAGVRYLRTKCRLSIRQIASVTGLKRDQVHRMVKGLDVKPVEFDVFDLAGWRHAWERFLNRDSAEEALT